MSNLINFLKSTIRYFVTRSMVSDRRLIVSFGFLPGYNRILINEFFIKSEPDYIQCIRSIGSP